MSETVQTFAEWKYGILNAMQADRRVRLSEFRFASRVMEQVDRATRVAEIGDKLLMDEVPNCDRYRANDTRKRLTQLGWWIVERGHGGKPSRYRFLETNINALLDEQMIKREARIEAKKAERASYVERRKSDRRDVVSGIKGDVVLNTTGDVVKHTTSLGGRGTEHHIKDGGDVVLNTTRSIESPPEDGSSLRARTRARELTTSPSHTTSPPASHPPSIPPSPDAVMALHLWFGRGSWVRGFDALDAQFGRQEHDRLMQRVRTDGIASDALAAVLKQPEPGNRHLLLD